jgi:hypothetical protein
VEEPGRCTVPTRVRTTQTMSPHDRVKVQGRINVNSCRGGWGPPTVTLGRGWRTVSEGRPAGKVAHSVDGGGGRRAARRLKASSRKTESTVSVCPIVRRAGWPNIKPVRSYISMNDVTIFFFSMRLQKSLLRWTKHELLYMLH